MRKSTGGLIALVMVGVMVWVGYFSYREHVIAERETERFWELLKQKSIKADEAAELEALRRRVGERRANESTR